MSKIKNSKNLQQVISLLGDAWTLRIIACLESTELRFCEIERSIPAINPVTLTCRLKRLEEYKILHKKKKQNGNPATYELTEKGKDVIPIMRQIEKFAENFNFEKGQPK